MHFVAQIKRGSTIDRMWRHHNRLGGEVRGVLFATHNIATGVYVSKTLSPEAVVGLRDNPNIVLEAFGVAPVADLVGLEPETLESESSLIQPVPEPVSEASQKELPAEDPTTGSLTEDPAAEEPAQSEINADPTFINVPKQFKNARKNR